MKFVDDDDDDDVKFFFNRSKTTGEVAELSDVVSSDEDDDLGQNWSTADKLSQPASPVIIPRPQTLPLQKRITINVSGLVFEAPLAALAQHPTTVLGSPEKRARYWVERRLEYFFDRHRPSFDAIYAYLVEGCTLKRPPHVPSEIFLKEVWRSHLYSLG